jgi:hypothetical protein
LTQNGPRRPLAGLSGVGTALRHDAASFKASQLCVSKVIAQYYFPVGLRLPSPILAK